MTTYLLRLNSIIRPVDARQGLRVPPELVVACVGVDDGGAVVGARGFHCAFWVDLGGGEGEEEDVDEGERNMHCRYPGGAFFWKRSLRVKWPV
jgi:hypothetical protein